MTDDLVLLQEETPYDRSIKWTIHNRYFQARGSKAWLNGEVPYYITCNTAAARQNAEVVHAAAQTMEAEGTLKAGDPVRVLEIASGLGAFALNFVRAFRDLDAEKGTTYAKRLHYMFSDYSQKNLEDASTNPALAALQAEGTIGFYVVDATMPETMRKLGESTQQPMPNLVGVVANYLHCCLTTGVIRKNGNELTEKWVRLSLRVPTYVQDRETYARECVEKPVDVTVTENLVEDVTWRATDATTFDEPFHADLIREVTAAYPVATMTYPKGSLRHIGGILPRVLTGGVLLISDKGYPDITWMEGERSCEPSIHGNSFAHSLNFPLIEAYAKHLGQAAVRTSDPTYSIQTIMIERRPQPALANLFTKLFIEDNPNVESSDNYSAGRKFENSAEYATAIRFYARSLKQRRYDAHVYYRLGTCYAEYGEHTHALEQFQKGKAVDDFAEYDFDFKVGLALHNLGSYQEAIDAYSISLNRENSEVTMYDIGLCEERLGRMSEAASYYERALAVNPQYQNAISAIEELKSKNMIPSLAVPTLNAAAS